VTALSNSGLAGPTNTYTKRHVRGASMHQRVETGRLDQHKWSRGPVRATEGRTYGRDGEIFRATVGMEPSRDRNRGPMGPRVMPAVTWCKQRGNDRGSGDA
jgi:hypothetical protein